MASLPVAQSRLNSNKTYFGPPLPKLETWARKIALSKGYRL